MSTPSPLRTLPLVLAAFLLGPLAGCAAEAEEDDDEVASVNSGEQALKVALASGCTLEAITYQPRDGKIVGGGALTCLRQTTYKHIINTSVQFCQYSTCSTVAGSSSQQTKAGGWSGSWVYTSKPVSYTPNAYYRTRACASVWLGGTLKGNRCSTSPMILTR